LLSYVLFFYFLVDGLLQPFQPTGETVCCISFPIAWLVCDLSPGSGPVPGGYKYISYGADGSTGYQTKDSFCISHSLKVLALYLQIRAGIFFALG